MSFLKNAYPISYLGVFVLIGNVDNIWFEFCVLFAIFFREFAARVYQKCL
jgi:hypothetical protein